MNNINSNRLKTALNTMALKPEQDFPVACCHQKGIETMKLQHGRSVSKSECHSKQHPPQDCTGQKASITQAPTESAQVTHLLYSMICNHQHINAQSPPIPFLKMKTICASGQ
jgi:hypothetical protein